MSENTSFRVFYPIISILLCTTEVIIFKPQENLEEN